MDFPPDPFLLLTHSYNPFVISLFTFSPFHLLFTPQSAAIVCFSLFRSNSHLVVRVPSLDHHLLPPFTSVFVLHLFLVFRIFVILFCISSIAPPRVRFFRRVSPLHVVFSSVPSPRTKSINSFTSLTPLTSLLFFASMHTCQRNHGHPKSYRLSCLTSFFPSTPHCSHSRILSYFIPCWLPLPFIHLSPFPEAIPFPFPIHTRTPTTAHKYPIGAQCCFLICIRLYTLPSLFPFVNPYHFEGVNQCYSRWPGTSPEGGARSCTPGRPNYLV